MNGVGVGRAAMAKERAGAAFWAGNALGQAQDSIWSAKDIARLGMLLALATSLHIFEAQLPSLPIAGAKIGLANLVSLFALYAWGFREALLIAVMRQLVGSLVTGTLLTPAFAFGLAGGVLSVVVMAALLAVGGRVLGPVAISLGGATAHNVGQLMVAWAMLGQLQVFYYLPYLLWFAVPSGALVGVTASRLLALAGKITTFSPESALSRTHLPEQAEVHRKAAWATGAALATVGLLITLVLSWQPAAIAHPQAKVTVGGEVYTLLPLDRAGRHELEIGGERLVLEVSDGRVRVVESTCPDQICVGTGWIRHAREAIACVPAQVLITVTGGAPSELEPELEYDALVY